MAALQTMDQVATGLPCSGEDVGVLDRNFPKNDIALASQLFDVISYLETLDLVGRFSKVSWSFSFVSCSTSWLFVQKYSCSFSWPRVHMRGAEVQGFVRTFGSSIVTWMNKWFKSVRVNRSITCS